MDRWFASIGHPEETKVGRDWLFKTAGQLDELGMSKAVFPKKNETPDAKRAKRSAPSESKAMRTQGMSTRAVKRSGQGIMRAVLKKSKHCKKDEMSYSHRDMSPSEAPNGPDAPCPLAGGVVAIPPSSMPGGVFKAELEAGECPDMVDVDVLGRTPRCPIHSPLSTPPPDAEYANSAGAGPPWKPYGSAMLRLR